MIQQAYKEIPTITQLSMSKGSGREKLPFKKTRRPAETGTRRGSYLPHYCKQLGVRGKRRWQRETGHEANLGERVEQLLMFKKRKRKK